MKIVVIGINHAGTSAIRTLLSKNQNHEVIAIDRNNNISFLGCGIALSVSNVVKNVNDLFYSSFEELKSIGAEVYIETEVLKIDSKKKIIYTKNIKTNQEQEFNYDKLIYAAGSWPVEPYLENDDDIENVTVCKLYQHALEIINKVDDPNIKTISIIGAGYIGLELAEAAIIKNKKVNLIDMCDSLASNYFDREFNQILEKEFVKNNVTLYLNTTIKGFSKNSNNQVKEVITDKGNIASDFVIKCLGFKPNSELLENVKKIKNGAIIVNEYMQTSDQDIYAIGDCAAIYNQATDQYENVALATNAVKGGIVAACHIAGLDFVKLKSIVATNALHVFGQNFAATGITENKALQMQLDYRAIVWQDNDRPEFMNEFNEVKIKLVYEASTFRLLGAQIWSDSQKETHTEIIFALAIAIQNKMSIIDLALSDIFFLPHFNKPFNFIVAAILKALGFNYVG